MRRWLIVAGALACVGASLVFGQAEPSADQLRHLYADTLHQLQEAQDRKNQLAAENDRLNTKVADLQKQLDAARDLLNDQQRSAALAAAQTIDLRCQAAAWQEFVSHDPALQRRWQLFLRASAGAQAPVAMEEIGAAWPWSSGQ